MENGCPFFFFFFQAEDGIRDLYVTGVQTCALPISYASLQADQDTRDSTHQGMRQEMTQVGATFRAAASYFDPEILKAGKAQIEKFIAAEPRLKPYKHELDDLVRRSAHTLSDSEEKILADAGPMAGSASSIYGILSNADFPYSTVTLSDGKAWRVDQ